VTGDEPQVEVAPADAAPVDPSLLVGAARAEQAAEVPLAIPVSDPAPVEVDPAPVEAGAEPVPEPPPAIEAEPFGPVVEPVVDAELGGYAELRFAGMAGVTGNPLTVAERVRPRLAIGPADGPLAGRLKAEVVVEAALTQGRDTGKELSDTLFASDVGELLTLSGCTYAPEPRYASVSDVLSVERLHVDFNLKALDLTVGRQAIRWGSGLYFHPTDLYAEVLIAEPWREPQGINAVKANVPIGTSDVTAVVAVGDDLSPFYTTAQGTADAIVFGDLPVSAAVRGTLRVGGLDIAAIGQAKADQAWFAGGDVRGTLGVGYWAEGGWWRCSTSPPSTATTGAAPRRTRTTTRAGSPARCRSTARCCLRARPRPRGSRLAGTTSQGSCASGSPGTSASRARCSRTSRTAPGC